MLFPPKGTLTDAGEGDGDGGEQKSQKKKTKTFVSIFVSSRKWTLTDAGDGDGGKRKKTPHKCFFLFLFASAVFDT